MHKGKSMLKLSQQKIEHHSWVGSSLALCSGGHIRILAQKLAVMSGFQGPQSFQQNATMLPQLGLGSCRQ